MMRTFFLRAASVLVAALTLNACGQDSSPLAPATATPNADFTSAIATVSGLGTTRTKVHGLTRNSPLPAPATVRATIGLLGGVINAPGGLTVVVPPGAVLAPTSFSVTALAGDMVAYEFQPHGARFLVPLVMTQTTKGIKMGGVPAIAGLKAAHFASQADLNERDNTAIVDELLGLSVSLPLGTMVFTVKHFSGYMVAW